MPCWAYLSWLFFFFLIICSHHQAKKFPTCILQYGSPRSATTTQFKLLCAIASLKTNNTKLKCKFSPNVLSPGGGYLVQKTHSCSVAKIAPQLGCSFFKTVQPNVYSRCNGPAKVVQNADKYFKEGFPYLENQIKKDYKPIFELSKNETNLLIDFMKKWEPTRRCCGFQMSTKYVDYLFRSGIDKKQVSGDHFCIDQNTSQLEEDLMRTELVQRYPYLSANALVGISSCVVSEFLMRLGLQFNGLNSVDVFGWNSTVLEKRVNQIVANSNAQTDEELYSTLVHSFSQLFCTNQKKHPKLLIRKTLCAVSPSLISETVRGETGTKISPSVQKNTQK